MLLPLAGGEYYIYLFALVFTNVILSASLRPSLTCGQLNIGHSAFMCIGAYTSALLAKNLGVPFELSLLAGAVLAAAVGLAKWLVRRARYLSRDPRALAAADV